MGRVYYNSQRLIPAPFVNVSKEYQKSSDGTIIGSVFTLNIKGTIIAYKGSPDSSGTFWNVGGYPADEVLDDTERLAAIIRKQEAIRNLFSEDGHQLEFQSLDGSQPMKCNPRVNSIEFTDDIWYDRCEYTINCESDILSVNGSLLGEDNFDYHISAADESWQFETNEDQAEGLGLNNTYRLTHNISATGKRFYNSDGSLRRPAWQEAREFVLDRLGLDNDVVLSSGILNLPSYYGGKNHVRSEQLDELQGNYSVTETWLFASGNALEEFTISTSAAEDTGKTTVSIEGTVTGLEVRDSNFNIVSTKWDNASTKFASVSGVALNRAQTYSGLTLNITPLTFNIGKNPINGVITYAFSYDNRPSRCITNSKSEVISIHNDFNVDLFAVIPVLGRAAGPVLQGLSSKREKITSLNLELVFNTNSYSGCSSAKWKNALWTNNPRFSSPQSSEIQAIVDGASPLNNGASVAYVSDQGETWEPFTGRYTYNITWVWQ